jgi:hypothetical protein
VFYVTETDGTKSGREEEIRRTLLAALSQKPSGDAASPDEAAAQTPP